MMRSRGVRLPYGAPRRRRTDAMSIDTIRDLIEIPGIWERMDRVEERLLDVSRAGDDFLTEIAQHLLVAGGKRYRPVLTQLAGEFGPTRDRRLIEAGAAVELIHIGSIYHDDVMDGADTRRGTTSVNARWDNSLAILAGDFLIARASEIAATYLGMASVELLAHTYRELVTGQALELRLTGGVSHGPADHYRVIGGKTASLIRTAARLGALAADAAAGTVEAVSTATWELGMVFQMTDDALDLVSTEEDLGKPAGSDIRQGVYTLPVLYALEGPDGSRIASLLQEEGPVTEDVVEEVIGLVKEGGYVHRVLDECRHRLARAAAATAGLPDIEARAVFRRMGEFLVDRVGTVGASY
ncbi:MAG: polyprenyl synthetase family protein [Acidimicrobiia bacterium]|nr:polyprenyl synthetase family protein [Acidimicrobiia bacterium]